MTKTPAPPPPCTPSSPKREAILAGAQTCFMEHGYGATSMDGVATAAGVSKATIYAYFTSKEDLFAAVIIGRCETKFGISGSGLDDSLDARATLVQVAERWLTFLIANETLALHRVVVAEAVRQPELAEAFWAAGPGRAIPRVAEIFDRLNQRGLLKVDDTTAASLLFVNMLKSELFFCRLLGLPEGTERTTFDQTVSSAVNVMLKLYAPA